MSSENGRLVPGARNLITDVPGLAVGNAHDAPVRSGVTVLLPDAPAVAAVDIRGGGSGSRETALLEPSSMVRHVDALVLSGGSAFGLDAAGGVLSRLAACGRGFAAGTAVVPIVPQAILFDMLNGGDKSAFRDANGAGLPYRALAATAFDVAAAEFALGNSGAGYGASSGSLKGGLGSASAVLPGGPGAGVTVGALVAVNSFGETVMPDGTFWAWESEVSEEFGGRGAPSVRPDPLAAAFAATGMPGTNTTIAIVATDLELTQGEAKRIAVMAQDGLARAIRPVHTPYDGDTVFALSTGRHDAAGDAAERTAAIMRVGTVAADCLARAVARGVYAAATLGEMTSWRERFGG